MKLIMTLANPATDAAALGRLEASLSLTLPSSYKTFLLEHNGGRPSQPSFPIAGLPLNPSGDVELFFGIGIAEEEYNLEIMNASVQERIPEKILLIADCGGSDFLCIDMRDGKETVKFWDHAHFWSTGEWREQDLYHVADNFDELVASLKENII